MTGERVAIIGGGVAGLNAARLLGDAGMDVRLFEARDRCGGRVLSVDSSGVPAADGFDLGPSWFWPRLQPAIADLIAELGLASFPQSSDGDVIFERMSRESAQRYTARHQEPESMRFVGGSASLASALADRAPKGCVELGARVTEVALFDGFARVSTVHDDGQTRAYDANHVVLAVPPRLAATSIRFAPALDDVDAALWRSTPTWMAGQAKFFALYDAPFWRAAGLSGTAQSMVGPMPEIHDATTHSGQPALFGFVGMSAPDRALLGEAGVTHACIAQFVRLFGPYAERPIATVIKDWAADPLTATAEDQQSTGHPAFAPSWVHGAWSDRLVLAGSEVSPREAGYLAGAAESSALAAAEVLRRSGSTKIG